MTFTVMVSPLGFIGSKATAFEIRHPRNLPREIDQSVRIRYGQPPIDHTCFRCIAGFFARYIFHDDVLHRHDLISLASLNCTEIVNLENIRVPHLSHGLYFAMESIENRRFFFRIVLKAFEQIF